MNTLARIRTASSMCYGVQSLSGITTARYRSDAPLPKDPEITELEQSGRRLDLDHKSLAARGYLRPQKPYTPPPDVQSLVLSACFEAAGSESPDFSDSAVKFAIIAKCAQKINHRIPSSLLASINDVDSLVSFYSNPVDTRFPLDRFKDVDLPSNLHIDYKYLRFNRETDSMFKGVTAYPGRSNIIVGLKAKKKYKGHKDEPEWLKYKHYV